MTICIFGFGFHDSLCTCNLVEVDFSELSKLVCSKCETKLRSEYNSLLADERIKQDRDGNFGDFLTIHINERLQNLAINFNNCEHTQLMDGICDDTTHNVPIIGSKYDRYNREIRTTQLRFYEPDNLNINIPDSFI